MNYIRTDKSISAQSKYKSNRNLMHWFWVKPKIRIYNNDGFANKTEKWFLQQTNDLPLAVLNF